MQTVTFNSRGVSPITGLVRRAGVIAIARFANQALIVLSPIVLVRLLSVEEFGRYREFLLYAGLFSSVAAFGINSSLLYFVPAHPGDTWRYVRQAVTLTALNSLAGAAILVALDSLLGGALVGEFAVPVALYTLLFVNVDFWEFLWLARSRPGAVFAYTSGRLFARMGVVIVAALLTGDVHAIIWSVIALEGMRLLISTVSWRRRVNAPEQSVPGSWGEQLRYCGPVGASLIMVTLNKSLGGLLVTKLMGPVALAHYTIGTYVQPIVNILRNSLSDVVLPEMARDRAPAAERLALWRRTTIVFAILLLPAGLFVARFAEPLVVTVFSDSYRAAAPVLQIYLLVLIRECFDFGVPLRAINRTGPIVQSNLAAMIVNLALLVFLVPAAGLIGAVTAFVVARCLEGLYLGWRMLVLFGIRMRELACWGDLARVLAALAIAAVVLYGPAWFEQLGYAGILAAAIAFLLTFAVGLRLLRLPEAVRAWQRLRHPLGVEP